MKLIEAINIINALEKGRSRRTGVNTEEQSKANRVRNKKYYYAHHETEKERSRLNRLKRKAIK